MSQEELIDHLYGISGDNSHLESCAQCRGRRQELARTWRVAAMAGEDVAADFLAAQRSRIAARIEAGSRGWHFRLVPALGVAATILMAALLSTPSPEAHRALASSDAQLFNEIYMLVENTEPRAAAPIHGLFEE
ncbi:MAG: hypothetical protein ACRD44_08215 [Bryobacteraceae bacterium]